MPEYLAPGVYVEETSFRAKSIEGVGTTTTGFIGPARYGPVTLDLEVLTSLLDFERVYGNRMQLRFLGDEFHNYLWHASRAFFEEGGRRLYVARTFRPLEPVSPAGYVPPAETLAGDLAPLTGGQYRSDGHARCWLTRQTAAVGAALRTVQTLSGAVATAIGTAAAAQAKVAIAAASEVNPAATAEVRIRDADLAVAALTTANADLTRAGTALAGVATAAALAKTEFAASSIDEAAASTAHANAVLAAGDVLAPALSNQVLGAAAAESQTRAGDAELARAAALAKSGAAVALPGLGVALLALLKKVDDALKDGGSAGKKIKDFKAAADGAKAKADAAVADPTKRAEADTAAAASWVAVQAATAAGAAVLIDARRARAQAENDAAGATVLNKIGEVITTLDALDAALTLASTAALGARFPRLFAANLLVARLGALRTAVDGLLDAAATSRSAAAAAASAPGVPRKDAILLRARFPGEAGNVAVRFSLRFGQNVLTAAGARRNVSGLQPGDLVWILDPAPGNAGKLMIAGRDEADTDWFFSTDGTPSGIEYWLNQPQPPAPTKPRLDAATQQVRIATLSVDVAVRGSNPASWGGLALQPGHRRSGADDSLASKFAVRPDSGADARELPIVVLADPVSVTSALSYYKTLFAATDNALNLPQSGSLEADFALAGGNDGQRPVAGDFEGVVTDDYKTGLRTLEDIEDISIVAAPGSTFGLNDSYRDDARSITGLLIGHAQAMRYRIAVLDSGNGQSIGQVLEHRGRIDSKYAALYYPWVTILDPVTRREIALPPSGFVAGIYARNDIQRAVWKAPANEVVSLAIGFEKVLNKAQQEVLNPEGVNCFRFFEGRGFRLWGARTISSDPEWKYVNVRRYFAYLERSIDKGTQWAVFEPNGEALWANVRRTIEDFLLNEWQNGALLGDKPEKAYFVRCDRSTMSQNDLDNGRLICLIGVAPLKPAEFVIFRIGQWTADRKN